MVGVSSTASDVIASLLPVLVVASKVYMSYRRGATLVPEFRKGFPPDLMTTRRRRPNFSRWLIDWFVQFGTEQTYGDLDPAWGLLPAPSLTLSPRAVSDHIIPALRDGSLTSLQGIKRFTRPNSIESTDGMVLDDVDDVNAVVCATG